MRVPVSTYRLQLNAGLTLRDAAALVPYLADLGVSDLYASPILAARAGSDHGYDVTDPTRLNPELGTQDDLAALAQHLRARDMGLLVDIVPNHMAASTENPWWVDVLRNGRGSAFAGHFEVDWDAQDGKVMLPILGRPFGQALERGELRLDIEGEEVALRYFENTLPLSPESVRRHFGPVPQPEDVYSYNGLPGEPASFDRLEGFLDEQHYRLAHWRVAARDISYRRFFDITDLVSVRVHVPRVFEATHEYLLHLAREGVVTGFRVDHVDGLHDPHGYLQRLQATLPGEEPWYVVVEKILGSGEELPSEWPAAGATGYEFADAVGGVQVDLDGARIVEDLGARLGRWEGPFEDVAATRKALVLRTLFAGEVTALVRELQALARGDRHARDLSVVDLAIALSAVTARMPVYRTYVRGPELTRQDRRWIEGAVREARRRTPAGTRTALEFLARVLTLDVPPGAAAERTEAMVGFVQRWQRLTGPATAKGVEDTAMYVFPGLLSRSEVGSLPGHPSIDEQEFHRRMRARMRRTPHALSASSTHDSKRSEDVRARLAVLSEAADGWARRVERWREWNSPLAANVQGSRVPDPGEELHLYQSIVGAWPLEGREERPFVGRIQDYAVKMAREAKAHTSWVDPDSEHERALRGWLRKVLAPSNERFRDDLRSLLEEIEVPGAVNSLAQVVLKAAAPGVPDFYQGAELWYLALVDPDNRRPVDFALRRRLLRRLDRASPAELLEGWRDGRVKLAVTQRALRFRRAHRELFERGRYMPLRTTGPRAANALAFARRLGADWAVAIVPRFVAGLAPAGRFPTGELAWRGTNVRLPDGAPTRWTDALTGTTLRARAGRLPLAGAFSELPVALLGPASDA